MAKMIDYEKELVKINEQKLKLQLKECELKNKYYEQVIKEYADVIDDGVIEMLNKMIGKKIKNEYGQEFVVDKNAIKKALKRAVENMQFQESDFS